MFPMTLRMPLLLSLADSYIFAVHYRSAPHSLKTNRVACLRGYNTILALTQAHHRKTRVQKGHQDGSREKKKWNSLILKILTHFFYK